METTTVHTLPADACIDSPYGLGGGECGGTVEYRPVPGGSPVARCEVHFERRLDRYENSIERYANSDVAPDWFDPTYCGERWDDDY